MEKNHIAAEHPFGYIKDGKVFLKPFLSFEEREIGIVKDTENEALAYFENRFKTFEKKIEDFFAAIDAAENKGSYLQKLLHLKELCGSFEALGDFSAIYEKLVEKENALNDLVAKNRLKNLSQKQALLQELELLKDSSDWINAGEQIKEIKNKWIRIGGVDKESEDQVENIFKSYLDTFFSRRQAFYDERNQINAIKIAKYEALAERVEKLVEYSDMRKALDELKRIKMEWRGVGIVPKKFLEPVMKRYKDASAAISAKIQEYRKNRPPRTLSPFLAEKMLPYQKLMDRTEQILKELPWGGDDDARKMYDEWRKLGPLKVYEFKEWDEKFKVNVARILDIYFMTKIVNKRTPGFARLPLKEQVRIKIGVMKELVQRDKDNIENFENSFAAQAVNGQPNSFDKVFGSKLKSQKRNLESKQRLLSELEDQYAQL